MADVQSGEKTTFLSFGDARRRKVNPAADVMNKLFLCTALNATESLRSTREDQK